jgi:diguanylate cyclase (GGDEF)-like protein
LITEEGLDRLVASLVATAVPYSVAVCDIDKLSAYNEKHGSAVGNHALRFMAEVMDTTFRPSDVIARSTDNEFVAVLPGVSAIETGAACERVREALAIRLYDGTNIPHFQISMGVADTTGDARFTDIAHAARFALMQAKAAGGNRVAIAGEAIILNAPTT